MSEKEVISKSENPQTIKTLTADLKNIEVKDGMVLLVHSSLSSIGWVVSGAVTVILALEEVLEKRGTLVMTAFSGDLSDPSKWVNPLVPGNWCDIIKETMPVFDPDIAPTRGVGKIAEVFRKQKSVYRSNHPQVSFAARGRYAKYITGNHDLENALGEGSPLAKIYKLDGYVLLMGVGYSNSTSLHLAEYRADYPSKTEEVCGAPFIVSGKRKWVDLKDIKPFTEDFETLGFDFINNKKADIRTGYIGQARSQLFRQKDLVDFADL